MKSTQQLLMCSLVILPIANVQAKDTKDNSLNVGISADYSSTDNAKRAIAETAQLEEIQAIYVADFGASYQNEWSHLSSAYSVQRETFQHDSQPSATEVEGRTQLMLGGAYQPLSLLISHSRTAMLNSPEALDFARNRDTQEIISIAPSAKTHVSAADSLVLTGSYSDVSYKEEAQKKSAQKGLQFKWIREISKTDRVQVAAQQMNTEFEFVPSSDYKLQSASAQYDVSLKRFNYSLQVGYSSASIKSSDEDFTSPTYKVESSYTSGAHIFSLSLSKAITNSSMGMGGQSLSGGVGNASGTPAKGVGIDLINMRSANLSWSTSAICERCNFSVTASQSTQDYKDLMEDSDEFGVGTDFRYNFTRAASVTIGFNHREQKFANTGARVGFDSDDSKIEFNYAVTNDLQLKLYAHQERRTSALDEQSYKENIIGLNLSYHF